MLKIMGVFLMVRNVFLLYSNNQEEIQSPDQSGPPNYPPPPPAIDPSAAAAAGDDAEHTPFLGITVPTPTEEDGKVMPTMESLQGEL